MACRDAQAGTVPDLMSKMPVYKAGDSIATRNAGADCIQPVAQEMPFYLSGSADLHGSNKNYIKDVGDFSKNNYAGRHGRQRLAVCVWIKCTFLPDFHNF